MVSTSTESKRSDTDDANTIESNSSDFQTPKFKFPPAPRLCKSANNTSCSCQSDSSISDGQIEKWKKRNRKNRQNSSRQSVSFGISKTATEAEFIVVCDVKKENAQVIQDLNDAQVNLIHVSSTSKNAADEKLRQSLRRFAETHQAPAAVVLISGDINFAADLSDLRYRKKIHVILVHNSNVADALVLCANESLPYSSITENLPVLKTKDDLFKLQGSLQKVFAMAQRRLRGEDVFGNKIGVANPTTVRESPCRSYTGRKSKSADAYQMQAYSQTTTTEHYIQESGLYYQNNQKCSKDGGKAYQDQNIQIKLNVQEHLFRPVHDTSTSNSLPDQLWLSPFSAKRSTTPQIDDTGACPYAPHSWPVKINEQNRNFFQNVGKMQNSSSRPSTPQDEGAAACNYLSQSWPTKFNESNKNFMQNIERVQSNTNTAPVDLIISNVDPSIDTRELPMILTGLLKQYVMILGLNVNMQSDGNPIAVVKVANHQEAQLAISHLHRYKLGYKRLTIAYAQSDNSLDPVHLKEMVVALLQEVPGNRMLLFKLIALLESRYHVNVSVSEINKLKDVCRIIDELGGRIVTLISGIRTSPQANLSRTSILYCSIHCPNGLEGRGWCEIETTQLPNILMPLKQFSEKVNELLSSHMGTLPLLSFPICYKLEFNQTLPIDDNGVPLEHLVTCVKNVELKLGGPNHNIKYIKREIKTNTIDIFKEESMKSSSPSIVFNIQLFCREMVDLLKTHERCQLPLGRLIPAYHHHFGRQCRVADYGFTKLIDLLESQIVSSVVQIIAYGTRRVITLTHSTQLRRFTADLLRVLKGQVSRQLTAIEFPIAYERIVGKPFNPIDYGLCSLSDLLEEVPDNAVVIIKRGETLEIAIPKREQTGEEIARTKQFAEEVVELLGHSPECSMLFNKFVPAYHHHFGYQCKVSDYGFTKLIELFEAIPDTVCIEEMVDGERTVHLTLLKALKVLGEQIANLIKHSKLASISLESLPSNYLREYGYPLKPESYECVDYYDLIAKLTDYVQVTQSSVGPLLVLVHPHCLSTISMRVWGLLLQAPHRLSLSTIMFRYRFYFQRDISLCMLEQLTDIVKVYPRKHYITIKIKMDILNYIWLVNLIISVHGCNYLRKNPLRYYVGLGKWSDTTHKVYYTGAILKVNHNFIVVVANSECLDEFTSYKDIKLMKWRDSGNRVFGRVRVAEVRDKFVVITPREGFTDPHDYSLYNPEALTRTDFTLIYLKSYASDSVNVKESQARNDGDCQARHYPTIPYDNNSMLPNDIHCYRSLDDGSCCLGDGYLVTVSEKEVLAGIGLPMKPKTCFKSYFINTSEDTVSLTPLYIIAAQLYDIIYNTGGQLRYSELENAYKRHYGKEISYSNLNIKSMDDLITHLSFMLLIRGSGKKTNVILKLKLTEYGIPSPFSNSDNQNVQKEEAIEWPPPPTHEYILTPKSHKKVNPPKPDTPPTPGSALFAWSPPSKFDTNLDISVLLPPINTPKSVGNFDSLTSPTNNLLQAYQYQFNSAETAITPPHPKEVPMPDKLLCKDDSNDSGLVANSNVASENEMDMSNIEQTVCKFQVPSQSRVLRLYGNHILRTMYKPDKMVKSKLTCS
ncbi:limkain b lkap [Holotrichia oblita]|uniref:Limkain b lkap n=1 Tax=Holotrichia oblita TaxID=644536 RepID=A0ACB9SPM1_HOLOL|nr:limkain b lkap [Holotrichia oblita]